MKKRLISLIAPALAAAGMASPAAAQTVVNADIAADTTWNLAGAPYILSRPIFVKNGATLTILPGVIVRGQPRTAAPVAGQTTGTPGALIVTQSGRLVANASASNPIIMTTAAVDNDNDGQADDVDAPIGFKDTWQPGDTFLDDTPTTAPLAPLAKGPAGSVGFQSNVQLWGGLVILGNAPTNNANKCGVGYGKCTIEGLTVPGFPAADATYGGVLPHDNSGILRYVSIRHAGDEIGNSNELNGLSLGGVGDGTTLEFIEVYANFDDGFEWFGGTVRGNHLLVSFAGDDMFDIDEGYTGVNQFLFGIMPFFNENDGGAYGSASGDKASEFDGDNFRPDAAALNDNVNTRADVTGTVFDATPWPLSYPAMFNMTLIGATPDAGQHFTPVSAPNFATKRGIQFRNGFAGEVHNTIVVNTGAETGIEVGTGTGAPGFNVTDNATNDLINLVCSTLDDGAALGANEQTVVQNGDALVVTIGGTLPAAANSVNPNPAPNLLVNEDVTFDPTGNAAGKLAASLKPARINPRPRVVFPPLPVGGCPSPSGGLDPAATYRGAFVPGAAAPLWTDTWTALFQGGLL
jgi:hypothetical protein